jgi:hypothetical protein
VLIGLALRSRSVRGEFRGACSLFPVFNQPFQVLNHAVYGMLVSLAFLAGPWHT